MREPWIREVRLRFAVERWSAGPVTIYSAGHGLLLNLLDQVDTGAAKALHDYQGRKAFALSPVEVTPRPGGLAEAEFRLATWDPELGELCREALARTIDRPIRLGNHVGCTLDVADVRSTLPEQLLISGVGGQSIRVTFTTPTFFSLGRTSVGRQHYGLLPVPELVVSSWLRAWVLAGGETFGIDVRPESLSQQVALWACDDVHTLTVSTSRTALSGFLGKATLAWIGTEAWGPDLLRALALFSTYCGTGAKTGHGFGRTSAGGWAERNDE